MTTPDDVRRILKTHPRLGVDGFDSPVIRDMNSFLAQVASVRESFTHRNTDQIFSGPRPYKCGPHICIPAGAAITAAILEGFTVIRQAGPNCVLRRVNKI